MLENIYVFHLVFDKDKGQDRQRQKSSFSFKYCSSLIVEHQHVFCTWCSAAHLHQRLLKCSALVICFRFWNRFLFSSFFQLPEQGLVPVCAWNIENDCKIPINEHQNKNIPKYYFIIQLGNLVLITIYATSMPTSLSISPLLPMLLPISIDLIMPPGSQEN